MTAADKVESELQGLRAQQALLRMVKVVWPHEGQEVNVVGTFNGWSTQV